MKTILTLGGKKLFLSSLFWNTGWIKRLKWKISRSTLRKFRHLCMDALLNLLPLLFSIRREKTHRNPKEIVIKRSDTNCSSITLEFAKILQIMDLKCINVTMPHIWRKEYCSFIYSMQIIVLMGSIWPTLASFSFARTLKENTWLLQNSTSETSFLNSSVFYRQKACSVLIYFCIALYWLQLAHINKNREKTFLQHAEFLVQAYPLMCIISLISPKAKSKIFNYENRKKFHFN